MIKTNLIRLLSILITVSMALAMFACNNEKPETPTDTDTENITEAPTDSETQTLGEDTEKETESESAETDTQTESATESVTEAPTESDTQSDTDTDIDTNTETDTETVTETESEAATECEHPYSATAEGHWKPACSVCGKGEGKMQDHEIYEKIKDQGDRLAYIYLCSICDFVVFKQELSYDINVYIPPTDLAATRCYNYSGAYYFEDNVGFTRFTSSGSAGIIYAYEDTACEDISGRYLIMKVRMSGGSSVTLNIQSSMASSSLSVSPCEISDDWCTLIVDLAAVNNGKGAGYIPDGGGDYYLKKLYLYLDGNTVLPAGGYIDISYITVVETMEDARDFVDEKEVLYIYDNIMMNPFPSIEGVLCQHKYEYTDTTHSKSACEVCGAEEVKNAPHNITEKTNADTYTYACECGYTYSTSKTVSSDVNVFLSPSYIAKHADNSACWSGGELMYEEGGEPFARIYGKDKDAAGKYITDDKKVWNVYSNGITVTGQYLVIKYRVPDNDLIYAADKTSKHTQSQIRIYTSTQRSMATDEKDGFYLPVSENNKWNVAIINLAFTVGNSGGSTYVMNEDGTYTMKFMQLRLFYGGISTENDYTDIAYIGFCDKLEEAVSLVVEDEYYWQCNKGERTGYTVNKAEGPDPSDEIPETETETETEVLEEHVITEKVQDGVYSYTCTHCTNTLNSITVSDTVNKFYSPAYLSTVSGYNSEKKLTASEDGTVFTRITGKNGTAFEYELVNRSGNPSTDVGAFRYVVLRIRVSNATKHLNFVFETEKASTSVRLNNSLVSGEWTTLIIDMDKLAKITANSDGSYKIKHCRFYPQDLGSDYVDFAYIAFCDDWDEVAPLCVDKEVTLITHTSNAGGKVNSENGGCLLHIPTESVSGGTYKYACANCGEIIMEKTVSTDINLFISPATLGSAYGFNSELQTEDGLVYKRFTSTSTSGHVYVRNKAALADTGKFLVIKMRVNNSGALTVEAGAASLSGVTQEPVLKKGSWQTVVIDLSSYANYALDQENADVQLRITAYGSAGFTIDIAYVAIVDNKAEAVTLIDEETYDHYTSWKTTPVSLRVDQESCVACVTKEKVNGNTYSYSDCTVCGRTFEDATKTVSADVTKYYSASALASAAKYNASVSLLADESGEAFARITSGNGNAFEYYIVKKDGTPVTDPGEDVRYVMFKVRMSDISCEYNFSIATKDGKGGNISLHVTMTEADEWVTIVADMDSIGKLDANSGGDHTLKQFFMYTSATGSNTLDIACVAFCNSWEEIASASGDDTAMLMTVGNGMGTLVSTADGSPITK